jgi:Fur family transcriptional regulator, ferric uptake regulator
MITTDKSMVERLTPNQQKVLALLNKLEKTQPISAQGIYLELRNRNETVGIATVYRALEALKVRGMIRAQMQATGEALYSLLPADQHHLNCLQCGISLPIHLCPIANQSQAQSQIKDFKVFYHTLEFFGLCGGCQTTN